MAKMTKVFGAILCVLGGVYMTVSVFLYLNSSSHLDYNTGKFQTMSQAHVFYYFFFAFIILAFGVLLAKDRVLDNDHH